MFKNDKKYVLASASPRRVELLTCMGLEFSQIPAQIDEHIALMSPEDYVCVLASKKARAVALTQPQNTCTIGADTIVVLDGHILGKPKDRDDARIMLNLLSGQTHRVYTGVALCYGTQIRVECDVTNVTFACLSEREIDEYLLTDEPLDKAGAYGVQGRFCIHVTRLEGSYFNVMGLPVHLLYKMLDEMGLVE